MYSSEDKKIIKFIELRNEYIDLLESGKIDKLEFNKKNNEICNLINLRPFSVLDSFDKALYNYNYYNSKAKMNLLDCNRYKQVRDQRSSKRAKMAENNKLNNYFHKDQAIIAMLKFSNLEHIEAYHIVMHSKNLVDSIFEINFLDKDRVILHTKNKEIKTMLLEMGVFRDEIQESLISSYINN